jgi:pimeloyl-ACP methyl ester carboxylesterase
MQFTAESLSDGVVEREFTLEAVTGVLWTPESGPDRLPLVLAGHGGGQHKKSPATVTHAHRLVKSGGFAVVAIDLPGHGGRTRTAADDQHWLDLKRAREAGESIGPIVVEYCAEISKQAVPEWQMTLDALQELPEIGAGGPVAYMGAMMSTAIGVPLAAADDRITAAVFRCFFCSDSLLETAGRVTVPIHMQLQWHDEDIEREDGLKLFDAFASTEKTLHANAGTHHQLPRFEDDGTLRFLVRHLGREATSSV